MLCRVRSRSMTNPNWLRTHTSNTPHLSLPDDTAVPTVSDASTLRFIAITTYSFRLPGSPLACHPASQAHQLQLVVCRRVARHVPLASFAIMSQYCTAVPESTLLSKVTAVVSHLSQESAQSACSVGVNLVLAVIKPYLVPSKQ